MSEVMAAASRCTGSERKSVPDSSMNTNDLRPSCCREEMVKKN